MTPERWRGVAVRVLCQLQIHCFFRLAAQLSVTVIRAEVGSPGPPVRGPVGS